MSLILPFMNESEAVNVDGLDIENRLDRVSIYGSTDLTRDKAGLQKALALKAAVDVVVAALESEDLPDHIATNSTNP